MHSKLNNKSHTISSRVSSTIIRRPGKSNNNRKGVKVYQASGGETTITDKTSAETLSVLLDRLATRKPIDDGHVNNHQLFIILFMYNLSSSHLDQISF